VHNTRLKANERQNLSCTLAGDLQCRVSASIGFSP
jgi:hypothetical protein